MVTQKPSGCLILTEGSGMKKIDEWFRLNESWCHSIRTLDIRSTLLYLGEPVDSTEKSGLQALARPTCQSLYISDPLVELLRITGIKHVTADMHVGDQGHSFLSRSPPGRMLPFIQGVHRRLRASQSCS